MKLQICAYAGSRIAQLTNMIEHQVRVFILKFILEIKTGSRKIATFCKIICYFDY
jgi:hypothetical protein